MKVKIRAGDFRLSLPLPVGMIGFVARRIPDSVFARLRAHTPEPYSALVTKESIGMILEASTDILAENPGLEIVHVDLADGTFVSVTL